MAGFFLLGTTSVSAQTAAKQVKNLKPVEFKKLMADKDVIILDVRTPREVAQGKIDGAVNIPLNTISKKVEKLDKTKKYLVYCRSGARSRRASNILAKNGLEVYNLLGGFLAWQRQ
jgi:rhodanese-related sulfurtransferase